MRVILPETALLSARYGIKISPRSWQTAMADGPLAD